MWWSTAKTYKNAIPNELYLELNAELHNRITGDTTYLSRAKAEWSWFSHTGLISASGLINDGLTTACKNNNGTIWTYNQGVVLGGLSDLYLATGDKTLLTSAKRTADAAVANLSSSGILTEPCEATSCDGDQASFKGIFMSGLRKLANTSGTTAHNSFIARQSGSIQATDTNTDGQSGLRWTGPFDHPDRGRQSSALAALNAAS